MYSYKGISTNNLKNISVGFEDHEIVYIGTTGYLRVVKPGF